MPQPDWAPRVVDVGSACASGGAAASALLSARNVQQRCSSSVLADLAGGAGEGGQAAQEALVGLVRPGNRAVALPAVAPQRVQAAVVAGAGVGVGVDGTGRLRAPSSASSAQASENVGVRGRDLDRGLRLRASIFVASASAAAALREARRGGCCESLMRTQCADRIARTPRARRISAARTRFHLGLSGNLTSKSPCRACAARGFRRVKGVKEMPAIVLVGAQWGDEGKGKATDLLGDPSSTSSGTRAATTPGTRW